MTHGAEPNPVVQAFANALDGDDFDAAAGLIASHCRYDVRGEVHNGPGAIVASYAAASEMVIGRFDGHEYDSVVTGTSIRFRDHLQHGGSKHTFVSRQHLVVENGLIVRIRHEDLAGERERLAAWLGMVGVSLG